MTVISPAKTAPHPLVMPADHLAAAQALLRGRSSATVLAAMSPQQPDALVRAFLLVARDRDVHLTLIFADLSGTLAFLDEQAALDVDAGRLRLVSVAGAVSRRWSRRIDQLAYSLWDIDRLLRNGDIAVDIVLARVRAGGRPGEFGFGDMVGYTASVLETPAQAVFEMEPGEEGSFPGASPVRRDRAEVVVTGAVRGEGAPGIRPSDDPAQQEIGRLVASLVPDEATLQLGLGAIPEVVAPRLAGKRALGLHSGIFVPALQRLIADGTVTGLAKSRDPGRHVATGILAPSRARVADWGDATALQPVRHTHDPAVLLGHHRLWAINSALEVDLGGQVNAEFVDGLRIASGGGLADFAAAAHAGSGGASVIALPSQTRDGRSRLVAHLGARTPPTLQGALVDFVVTEQGVASLRGLSQAERAQALVQVAHPAHREALRRQWKELS